MTCLNVRYELVPHHEAHSDVVRGIRALVGFKEAVRVLVLTHLSLPPLNTYANFLNGRMMCRFSPCLANHKEVL